RNSLCLEHPSAGQVIGAVGTAGQVGEVAVAVIGHEVMDQRAHAGSVVAPDVDRSRARVSCQGHDRDDVGQPGDFDLGKHLVVQYRFAGFGLGTALAVEDA